MALKIRCKDHPLYKGMRIPRVLCNACWYLFHVRTHIEQSSDERLEVMKGLALVKGDNSD